MGITKTYCPEFSGINSIPPVALYKLSQQRTAKITVTPFFSQIKYRYRSENWQTIEGDSYTLDQQNIGDIVEIPNYFIEFKATVNSRFPPQSTIPAKYNAGDTISGKINSSYPGIILNSISSDNSRSNWRINFNYIQNGSFASTGQYLNTDCYRRNISVAARGNEQDYRNSLRTSTSTSSTIGVENLRDFTLVEDTSKDSLKYRSTINECIFKIFNCGQLVYEQIEENCPEIEIDNCVLDYQQQEIIDLDLDPFEILYIASGINNIGSSRVVMAI